MNCLGKALALNVACFSPDDVDWFSKKEITTKRAFLRQYFLFFSLPLEYLHQKEEQER